VSYIFEPGTLDGGDVLKVGNRVYVGMGGRTNSEGFLILYFFVDTFSNTSLQASTSFVPSLSLKA
jgi:N-dimethylarginine dimethylaminohydrolase